MIRLNGHQLIVLRLEALSLNESTAAFHLLVTIAVVQLHFQSGQALVILLVQQQGARCQQLEADVVGKKLVLEEEGVHFFEVAVAEVALSKEIDPCDMVVGEGY